MSINASSNPFAPLLKSFEYDSTLSIEKRVGGLSIKEVAWNVWKKYKNIDKQKQMRILILKINDIHQNYKLIVKIHY